MAKRLYRVKEGKVIAGVCAGIGDYFDIDPVIVRIVFVLLMIGMGVSLLVYFVFWVIIPIKPSNPFNNTDYDEIR